MYIPTRPSKRVCGPASREESGLAFKLDQRHELQEMPDTSHTLKALQQLPTVTMTIINI